MGDLRVSGRSNRSALMIRFSANLPISLTHYPRSTRLMLLLRSLARGGYNARLSFAAGGRESL
jgi:hypothetical protein